MQVIIIHNRLPFCPITQSVSAASSSLRIKYFRSPFDTKMPPLFIYTEQNNCRLLPPQGVILDRLPAFAALSKQWCNMHSFTLSVMWWLLLSSARRVRSSRELFRCCSFSLHKLLTAASCPLNLLLAVLSKHCTPVLSCRRASSAILVGVGSERQSQKCSSSNRFMRLKACQTTKTLHNTL